MKTTFALILAATACVSHVAGAPSECSTSYNGNFQITVVKPSAKRSLSTRDTTCGRDGYLTLKLQDGQLTDSKGRLGYIASNYQFQFDLPPQENSASVGGYSACQNGSLALAGSSIFYQCMSGDFYNLYDRSWAPQCQPIHIDLLPCSTDQKSDKPNPQSPPGTPVSQIGDGQPQAPSATPRVPVGQIPDGQPQAPAATPASPPPHTPAHNTTMPPKPSGPPVAQIPDGQPQVPGTKPNSPRPSNPTIPDGIPKAPITAGGNFNKATSLSVLVISALAALLI